MAWLIALVIAIGCWILFERILGVPHDAKEPPMIPQTLPYVGHLLGMLNHGSHYYTQISSRFPLPIYTLRVPRNKIYVVNSPSLVAAVDRQSKTISFGPYVVEFAKRILLPSAKGLEALRENLNEEDGKCGCRPETLKAMHLALAPGEDLERTTENVLDSISRLLEHVQTVSKHENIKLFSWVRKLVTRASTDAVYGAHKNPFQDPAVEAAFWAMDKDFAFLGLNILPSIIAPRGCQGRRTLFEAFHQYYAQNGHASASRLVQARYEVNRKYNIRIDDIEHFDLSLSYALLTNTVPAVSWALYHIYSQPSLLEEARTQLSSCVSVTGSSTEAQIYNVNLAEAIAGFPLLASLVQETLRIHSTNASGRVVLKDTMLEDQYLLKKDSMLLIPSAELHNNASVWGTSFKEFDPRRFMQKQLSQGNKPASAYRAFGGGAAVCPGRYLAVNEIMIILAMMVLRYDVEPAGGGHWVLPEIQNHLLTSILTPVEDIPVRITQRKGYDKVRWKFAWCGSDFSPAQPL